MTEFFIIVQVALLAIGMILLVYYSRMGETLNVETILDEKKSRVPRVVKIYTIALLIWLAFILLHTIVTLGATWRIG